MTVIGEAGPGKFKVVATIPTQSGTLPADHGARPQDAPALPLGRHPRAGPRGCREETWPARERSRFICDCRRRRLSESTYAREKRSTLQKWVIDQRDVAAFHLHRRGSRTLYSSICGSSQPSCPKTFIARG